MYPLDTFLNPANASSALFGLAAFYDAPEPRIRHLGTIAAVSTFRDTPVDGPGLATDQQVARGEGEWGLPRRLRARKSRRWGRSGGRGRDVW